jgi:hypothetical protein
MSADEVKRLTHRGVEIVRLYADQCMIRNETYNTVIALCDLALRVLNAPELELTASECATWGTCPVCARKHGLMCLLDNGIMNLSSADCHPARLDAAPTWVRLVRVARTTKGTDDG